MAKLVHNVQKKQHRERGQTQDRAKFGFLEKHKDYVKRAQNFHKKENTLKILREKAQERNPDEFYYAMNSKKVDARSGLLIKERKSGDSDDDEVLNMDQIKLLKSQDMNYIKTLRQENMLKLTKKKNALLFKSNGEHKIFVDDSAKMNNFQPEEYFNTTAEMLYRKENRLPLDQLTTFGDESQKKNKNSNNKGSKNEGFDSVVKASLDKKKLKSFKKMNEYLKRDTELNQVYERMVSKNELLKNGSKKKVETSDGKVIFKWKKQRKR